MPMSASKSLRVRPSPLLYARQVAVVMSLSPSLQARLEPDRKRQVTMGPERHLTRHDTRRTHLCNLKIKNSFAALRPRALSYFLDGAINVSNLLDGSRFLHLGFSQTINPGCPDLVMSIYQQSNDEKESTTAVTNTPKSISRRFLQRESASDGAHRSPLRAPMECDVMMASGVLPNSQPSPVENRGEEVDEEQLESARRTKASSSRRRHRDDKVRDILSSEASLDLSQGRNDSDLSQMGTISADVSPLASDGSMSDDNSPQAQRRIRRLEEALTEARNDALSWKERCLILESLLAESEKQRGIQGGGGERLCTPERRVTSDGDQGWKVHQDTEDAALSVGGNILSSPVTRSLHKTLSDEAIAVSAPLILDKESGRAGRRGEGERERERERGGGGGEG